MKKTMIVIAATMFLAACGAPQTETASDSTLVDSTFVDSTLTVDTATAEITDTTLVVEGN